jgi:YebC/PmpR family DNA-binding regulatory protein
MSGHSKWSKVKHQKATTDVVKGREFTKATRAITIAVREGGGISDPVHNFHLRLAIEQAHDVNMPKENIERAIEKGQGAGGGTVEQILYEGYGPAGVAIIIEAATDNKQRTVASIKNILERSGGTITSPGAVLYLFERSGIITVPKNNQSYDQMLEIAIDCGIEDIMETDDMFELYIPVSSLAAAKQQLVLKATAIDNTAIIMKPKTLMGVAVDKRDLIEDVVSQLEELDDVQHVFTNL